MAFSHEHLIDRLLGRDPEDNFIERKPESVKAQELRQALVAFSNSLDEGQTAVLFIGVDDTTGAVQGIDNADKLQRRVGDAGKECYPAIRPVMTVLELHGKRILAVEVAFSKDKPHFAGPAYKRSGSRSVKATDSIYRDLLTSHCGKGAELLRWKGKYITVRTVNKRLGNHYPDWEPGKHKEGTAKIISVDPFSATFEFTDFSAEGCVEPLNRIELDWDASKKRRMVIVRGVPGGHS